MIPTVGAHIKQEREKLGLKVYELAKKVKVNPVYITQIEKGVRIPSPIVFFKIITALKLPFKKAAQLKMWYEGEKYPDIRNLEDWLLAHYEGKKEKNK